MKKALLLAFIFIQFGLAQNKHFIYFKDKGIQKSDVISKASAGYNDALNSLSDRAVERRKKVMGDNFINYGDLPVNKEYITKLESAGIKIVHELKWFNSVSAYLTDEQIGIVKSFPFVEKVEPVKKLAYTRDEKNGINNLLKSPSSVSAIDYGQSYTQLQLSDIPDVHAKGITGEGVIIGLLDSGFDWQTHESLMSADVLAEYDFIFNDDVTSNQEGDVSTQHNHGTNVFSVIGGYKEGTLIGAAFGASYLLAKTENIPVETHTEEDNYAAALIWMEGLGVDITSSSLGYSEFDPGEESYTYEDMDGNTTIVTKAADEAFRRGVVVITAAGNEGNNEWHYIVAPADGFDVIAVGAVNSQNNVANYSGRGPSYDGRIKPDIVAQGSSVFAALAGTVSGYTTVSGTSDATPIASGVAGLLLSNYPHLTNYQVRSILQKSSGSADNPDYDRGYGLVSAVKAISYPNFQQTENVVRLYKAFLNRDRLDPASVLLHYSSNGSDFSEAALSFDGNHTFWYDFTSSPGDSIHFYFTYSDSSGGSFREPENGNYKSAYESLEITAVEEEKSEMPTGFDLSQNFPNPFPSPSNPVTTISYRVPETVMVKLAVYTILGEEVAVLVNSVQSAGTHTAVWDARNFASGVYIYRITAGSFISSGKMILSK